MENNPEITLLSSAMSVASSKKQIYRVIKPYETWESFYCRSYTDFVQLPHASSIIRLKDIDGINYNTNFKFSEDLDFTATNTAFKFDINLLSKITDLITTRTSISLHIHAYAK